MSKPFDDIYKPYKHRHFDEWPNCNSQRLLTPSAVYRSHDRDGELEIVGRCCKGLRATDLVPEACLIHHECGQWEYDQEVDYQRRAHPKDRGDLADHVSSLAGEEDNDGIDQTYQREGCDEPDELVLVVVLAKQRSEGQPSDDGCG